MDQDHASDRRKTQNRQAQRIFRDKRAQRAEDLSKDNEKLRAQQKEQEQAHANALHAYQERINKLLDDNRSLSNRNASLERELNEERATRQAERREFEAMKSRELHSRSVNDRLGFPNSVVQTVGTSMALPPISNAMNPGMHHGNVNQAPDPYADQEIDINAQWSNGAFNKGPNAINNHVDWTGSNMDIDKAIGGDCGFCNDSGPCPCREQESRKPKPTLAPGGCDACIADPERAARCKALADLAEVSQRPDQFTTANGNTQMRTDSVAQPTEYVSCSSLFDRANPRIPSISELFPGGFHAYPSQSSGAGFDVNEREVAHALQSLRNNGSAGGAPPA
jgi:flagellar biosynthesis GTPase FlhF